MSKQLLLAERINVEIISENRKWIRRRVLAMRNFGRNLSNTCSHTARLYVVLLGKTRTRSAVKLDLGWGLKRK